MTGTWRGGIVESMADGDRPTVTEWQTVSVPGRNESFVGESAPIAYERRFPDPRTSESERGELELSGVFGDVHVWLNESYHGVFERPLDTVSITFDPKPDNDLLVVCEPNEHTDGLLERGTVPPEAAVPGIRGSVTVSRRPPTILRDLFVRPSVTEDDARLSVTVVIDSTEPVDDTLTFTLRPEGFRGGGSMDRTSVEADAGDDISVETTIDVRDPTLWWPRELGSANRYSLRAKLGEQVLERSVGLRRVESDDGGFLVNGHRVAARGFTVHPGDFDDSLVSEAVEANATVLRFPNHVPGHDVYDACDEAGLLVWQGLAESKPMDVDRATSTGRRLCDRYGHHPSLVGLSLLEDDSALRSDPLGAGTIAKIRYRYRAWRTNVDRGGADDVAARLPDDIPVIPTIGSPGSRSDAFTLWPGWASLNATDVDWILSRYSPRSKAVAGFGAPTGDVHQDELPAQMAAIVDRRGLSADELDSYQVTVLKTVAEYLRYHGYGTIVADTLCDRFEAGGFGVLRADRTRKPGFGAIADSFEPLQTIVVGRPTDGASARLALVNDEREPASVTISWRAGSAEGSLEATADPMSVVDLQAIEIPGDSDALVIETATESRRLQNRYRLDG
ncbi:glycoside hydrolase [Halovivax gelatinilyticus]|uniref:glycoside hydrolase n=1 Tax=Halovivax gelatinilyticus TaxID=2961597 RepID=UPI0020CA41DC|nr:glycoside hydrolase [Halovivax gelatinilyticus]